LLMFRVAAREPAAREASPVLDEPTSAG
jgi:hypothetical protein